MMKEKYLVLVGSSFNDLDVDKTFDTYPEAKEYIKTRDFGGVMGSTVMKIEKIWKWED